MKNINIINKMTLWEKALFMSGQDIWSTWNFEHLGIQSIILSDGPHGIRKQLGASDHLGINESMKSTCFPTAATIASSWDLNLAKEIGECLGLEANQLGVNVVLGPGLNIKRNPLCGRNFEYFSEDPYISGKFASQYVKGIQSTGVSACPKHFAVNNQELRRMSNDSVLDERALREIYLRGFEIAIKEAAPMFIMTSYNKINGTYANENKYLLQNILFDEWKYDGAVVSDWGGSVDHVEGVKAGSHLEMPGTRVMGAKELVDAVEEGTLNIQVLNKRVDELLTVVLKLNRNKNIIGKNLSNEMINKHHNIAKIAATESIVLLENKNNFLPLKENCKISIVGDFAKTPRYQGAGSSVVNATKLESIMGEIQNYNFKDIKFSVGYERSGTINSALVEEAIKNSEGADAVLVFAGLTEVFESEGIDRNHMSLPENQNYLIEQLCEKYKNVVVILSGGSPVELPWKNDVQALLNSYLTGQAGSSAILDILVGKSNPSGKLSETFATKYSDIPNYKYYPGTQKTSEYRESIYVGYRYFESANVPVMYPFGYGLSYSNFEYSNFSYDKKSHTVNFEIKNISEYDGKDIPQIYIALQNPKVFRSKKQLAGFTKVFVPKKEKKQVTIKLDDRCFQYFNVETNNWETESGTYKIFLSKCINDVCYEITIDVEGSTNVNPYNKKQLENYYNATVKEIPDEQFEILLGRKIPQCNWDKNEKLNSEDTISQLYYAKSPLAKYVYKFLKRAIEKKENQGIRDLNMLFVYNQSFTAIYKMTNGLINKKMLNHILQIVNGHFFRGTTKLIPEFFRNKKLEKKVLRKIKGSSTK